jgi:four helix bundle suffix protein
MNVSSHGYKDLAFYKQAEIIYDFTIEFVKKYINPYSRTKDQMEQAGRSGKQNIAEGYMQQSLETRIKLLGVSRGSLEELLNDYTDFLRQNGLKQWGLDSKEAKKVRDFAYNPYNDYKNYKDYIISAEIAANAMICLINQTNALLDQKIRWLREKFIQEGGFRENLFKARVSYKNSK